MSEYKWIYAVGEIDPEIVEEAAREKADPRAAEWPEYGRQPRKNGRWDSVAMRNIRRVAIIVLAALVTAFGLLMTNEKVRAAVFSIFTKQGNHSEVRRTDRGVTVSFTGSNTEKEPTEEISIYDVTVGYTPEGFSMTEVQIDTLPNVRVIRLVDESKAEDLVTPQYEIKIGLSDEFEPAYSSKSFDKTFLSSINGMDAYIIDVSAPVDGKPLETCHIIFGDESITVSVLGFATNLEDTMKIAENIVW